MISTVPFAGMLECSPSCFNNVAPVALWLLPSSLQARAIWIGAADTSVSQAFRLTWIFAVWTVNQSGVDAFFVVIFWSPGTRLDKVIVVPGQAFPMPTT